MKIRNKTTGQIFEVLPGTLYANNIFEEVKDDEIKIGEPKVEFEIEKTEPEKEKVVSKKETTTKKKTTKKTKKGAKKNDDTK